MGSRPCLCIALAKVSSAGASPAVGFKKSEAARVAGHAAISPAMGVSGTAARSDVQRPSNNNPCGRNADMSSIDSSTAATADASGSFTVSIENFNGGRDGSRQVTMKVDASGTGDNFVAGTVSANGQAAPRGTGTEQITASLPSGTQCTGGASGNLCIASFTTAGGFGNCVVVQQAGAGGGGAATPANGNGNNNGNNAGNNNAGNDNTNNGGNAGNNNGGNAGNNNGGNGGNVGNNNNDDNAAGNGNNNGGGNGNGNGNRNRGGNGNANKRNAAGNEVQTRNTRKVRHKPCIILTSVFVESSDMAFRDGAWQHEFSFSSNKAGYSYEKYEFYFSHHSSTDYNA
ncbi:hypothetical protein HJFPF1_13341 [Paramyrothecium foliicola]|nr:hypothetical protein HJFPF1_13341 [Paramyrothecium foliicola]